MAATQRQYHLQCGPGDVGELVLLPGDPGRCALIASRLEGARKVAEHREFTTYTGGLGGMPVSVTSTGIGGPSAAIAAEELCNLGAHTLLRVGTCGGMQPGVRLGELVIPQAAARDDGTSAQYLPTGYPAVAHVAVVDALRSAAAARGVAHHLGVVQSKDSFYGEMDAERMPVAAELLARREAMRRAGALASEMECAALFSVALARSVRAGAVLLCINQTPLPEEGMPDPSSLPLDPLIDVAVDALRALIAAPA